MFLVALGKLGILCLQFYKGSQKSLFIQNLYNHLTINNRRWNFAVNIMVYSKKCLPLNNLNEQTTENQNDHTV